MTALDKLTAALFDSIDDPILIAAVAMVHDEKHRKIVIAAGLATQDPHYEYCVDWTTEGRIIKDIVDAAIKRRAEAAEEPEDPTEPAPTEDRPTVASAMACIRDEARARGGAR